MKALAATITFVIILIAGVGIYLVQNIDGVVKTLIEEVGSEATQSKVVVKEVNIKLGDGRATINGFNLANPEGFSVEQLLSLDVVSITIDTASLTKDVIVIPAITIGNARVLAEQVGGGTNIQALMNLMNATPAPTGDGAAGGDAADVLLAVKKISFTNGSLLVRSDVFGEKQLTLPDFVLTDIGTPEQGLTPDELGQEIASQLLGQIKSSVGSELSRLARAQAASRIKDKISESTQEGVNKLKSLFGGAEED